jgi:2-oxoisovalerate dehydrogenase E1 component alpha subunit
MTLLLGQTPRGQFLSLLGRKEDPNSGGRQMPGHYSERELNIVTSSAPSASSIRRPRARPSLSRCAARTGS